MVRRLIVFLALLPPGIGVYAVEERTPCEALAAQLTALSSIKTLQAQFICEKRIAALQQPLVSGGTIAIARAEQLRFSTLRPYVSEIILDHGNVLLKSQHETGWTHATVSARPGLAAIMGQVAAWSLGDTTKLDETYKVARTDATVPPPPKENAATGPADAGDGMPVLFVLTPIDAQIAKVIGSLTLGIDSKTHGLIFLQLTTADKDVTRYWFYNIKTNVLLPGETFTPTGGKHE